MLKIRHWFLFVALLCLVSLCGYILYYTSTEIKETGIVVSPAHDLQEITAPEEDIIHAKVLVVKCDNTYYHIQKNGKHRKILNGFKGGEVVAISGYRSFLKCYDFGGHPAIDLNASTINRLSINVATN